PVAVPALRPDDRADGPVLLDSDALDPAGGPLAVYGAALVGGGPVLAQADQADVAEDLPAVAGGGADQRLPRVLDRPGDGPGAHGEPPVLAGDGDGRRGRGGLLPRVEPVRAVAGRYGGVGGPLDRAVRPGGGHPALHRRLLPAGTGEGEGGVRGDGAARPRDAPGHPLPARAVQPAQRRLHAGHSFTDPISTPLAKCFCRNG